eukprot:GHVU01000659.1.p1 GENE.GHVU01000659.1~~GHVU01000659.1.p1  ORF type:complete len:141 (+),score=9.18 GHVU01000659.1:60-482(+)
MACVITQQGEVDKARNISEAKKIVEEAVRSVTSGDLSLWTRGANGEADILHPLTKLGLDASTWAAAIAYARQEGGSKDNEMGEDRYHVGFSHRSSYGPEVLVQELETYMRGYNPVARIWPNTERKFPRTQKGPERTDISS